MLSPPTDGPSDRWITFNATRKTRFWFVATGLTTGVVAASMLATAYVLRWEIGMLVGAVGLLPTVILAVMHTISRKRALAREQAFVASLPYAIPAYLEEMRQPRVPSPHGAVIEFFPRLTAHFASPPPEPALRKLCDRLPVRGSLAMSPEGTGTRVLITSAEGTMRDPWPWLRAVMSGLGPIVVACPVIEIDVARGPTAVVTPDPSDHST